MERNIPRAAIHVGTDKKSFSSQVGNEAERRGWDEKRYQLKTQTLTRTTIITTHARDSTLRLSRVERLFFLGHSRYPCTNACSTDLMNLASSRIWMPSVPNKFQGTVRTALSASSSVVTMMCLTDLPLVNRNSTRQIQMLTTARLYCKRHL